MASQNMDATLGVCNVLGELGIYFSGYPEAKNRHLLPTLHSVRTTSTGLYWFHTEDRLIGLEKAIATLEKEVGGGVILPKQ